MWSGFGLCGGWGGERKVEKGIRGEMGIYDVRMKIMWRRRG